MRTKRQRSVMMNGATSSNTGKYPKPARATSAATPSSRRPRDGVGSGSPISAPGEGRASVGGQSRPAGDGAPEPPHAAWPAVPAPTRSVPGHPQGGHRGPLHACGSVPRHLFAHLDRPADQARSSSSARSRCRRSQSRTVVTGRSSSAATSGVDAPLILPTTAFPIVSTPSRRRSSAADGSWP